MITLTCPTTPDLHVTAPADVQFTNGTAHVDHDTYQALRPHLPALGVTATFTQDTQDTQAPTTPRRARPPKEE